MRTLISILSVDKGVLEFDFICYASPDIHLLTSLCAVQK